MFQYSDYCTAYYVPECEAVCIYDEIAGEELQRIHADNAEHAETILHSWQHNAPEEIIAERL